MTQLSGLRSVTLPPPPSSIFSIFFSFTSITPFYYSFFSFIIFHFSSLSSFSFFTLYFSCSSLLFPSPPLLKSKRRRYILRRVALCAGLFLPADSAQGRTSFVAGIDARIVLFKVRTYPGNESGIINTGKKKNVHGKNWS